MPVKKCICRKLPGGTVVRTLCFPCEGCRFSPWLRNRGPRSHAPRPKEKKSIYKLLNVSLNRKSSLSILLTRFTVLKEKENTYTLIGNIPYSRMERAKYFKFKELSSLSLKRISVIPIMCTHTNFFVNDQNKLKKFLMWSIFKVFLEFVAILLLFHVFFFVHESYGILVP